MSKRIDHAAKASQCIAWAHEWQLEEGSTAATENAYALIAQAEATLALGEQQRIANLIALAESGRTTVNGARAALSGLYDGAVEDGSANMHIRADVAAALGIEQ